MGFEVHLITAAGVDGNPIAARVTLIGLIALAISILIDHDKDIHGIRLVFKSRFVAKSNEQDVRRALSAFMREGRSRLQTASKDQEIQDNPYISRHSTHSDTSSCIVMNVAFSRLIHGREGRPSGKP